MSRFILIAFVSLYDSVLTLSLTQSMKRSLTPRHLIS